MNMRTALSGLLTFDSDYNGQENVGYDEKKDFGRLAALAVIVTARRSSAGQSGEISTTGTKDAVVPAFSTEPVMVFSVRPKRRLTTALHRIGRHQLSDQSDALPRI
jgi:hypothetical protein